MIARPALLLAAAAALAIPLSVCAADSTPTVPSGFTIARIATIGGARELAFAPNGDLFVGTTGSDIYIVPHADGTVGEPGVFVHLNDAPAAGVAFAENTLFVGTQFAVWRVPYRTGDRRARSSPQKLASVRTSGVARDHVTTSVAFAKGTLYASVGSSCNNCDPDLDSTRATIGRISNGYTIIAKNIRNAIALTTNENTGTVWAGDAGQDELPDGHPYEFFDAVSTRGGTADYGWPYCYENRKRTAGARRDCSGVAIPRVVMPAYATPIGATFYPTDPRGKYAFPLKYAGGAFVSLHGSWHGPPFVAPMVVFIPMRGDTPAIPVNWNNPNAQWNEFVGGYQSGASQRRIGRPTGVAVGPQGDLFIADDDTGAIYRVRPR